MAIADTRAPLAAIARVGPLGKEAIEAISAITSRRSFAQDAFLLRAGEKAEWCHLVENGLVRELYIDAGGHEHTRSFIREGEMTGSLVDLLSGELSLTWIQALEPTTTWAFRYSSFDALSLRFQDVMALSRCLLYTSPSP